MKIRKHIVREISGKLNTEFVGKQLYYYDVVTSTMNIAREMAAKGVPEGTIIVADKQISGRGRMGRTWLSPKGNLALSIILIPELEQLPSIVMIAALAVLYTLKKIANVDAVIKWPNDILINGKKVCGILIENEVKGNVIHYTIIGIGLNLSLETSKFPEIATTATSLWQERVSVASRSEFIASLLSEFERLYIAVKDGDPIHNEWRAHLDTLGKRVEIKCGEVIEQGVAEDITKNGNLLLRKASGKTIEILAGDVTILKR